MTLAFSTSEWSKSKNPIFGPFFDDYWPSINPNTHCRVALWIEIAPLELPSDMQKDLIILLIRLVNQGTKVELVHGHILEKSPILADFKGQRPPLPPPNIFNIIYIHIYI